MKCGYIVLRLDSRKKSNRTVPAENPYGLNQGSARVGFLSARI